MSGHELRTPRLHLRHLRPDDRAAAATRTLQFYDSFARLDPALGLVGLSPTTFEPPFPHRADPCVEIGWRPARPWWGQGLVTEAAATCLAQARDELGLTEVVAFTSASNTRSRAVMIRLGMLPDAEADFDHPRLTPDDPRRRHVVYRTNWVRSRRLRRT